MHKKRLYHLGVALSLAPLAGMASAQSARPAATASKTGAGTGTITGVDARAGTVSIKHGPIAAIGWPAMTMTFKASPPSLLKGLRAGQRVAFTAKARGMAAEVTAIRPQ